LTSTSVSPKENTDTKEQQDFHLISVEVSRAGLAECFKHLW